MTDVTNTTGAKVRKPRFTGDLGLSFDAAQQDTVDITQIRPGAGRPKEDLSSYVKVLTTNYKANAQHRKNGAKTRVAWVNQCASEGFTSLKSKFSTAGKEHNIGVTWKILEDDGKTVKFALVAHDRISGRGRKPNTDKS